jgi:hypothetical protein
VELLVEYIVRRSGRPWEAKVEEEGRLVGEIKKGDGRDFVLEILSDGRWTMSPGEKGSVRPFSLYAKGPAGDDSQVLVIRDRIFYHKGKCYVLLSRVEGTPLRDQLGKKYICRVDSPPELDEEDRVSMTELRRARGEVVGELGGFGTQGHRVKLSKELEDVGLPLAAASYLMLATA